MKIKNKSEENLDVLISGNKDSKYVLVYVHGFGTNKDEGFNLFKDLAEYLNDEILSIRFDQSGYGKSEGEDYNFSFEKAAKDLESVLDYVKENYSDKEIFIIAHSLGTFVTSLLSPSGISKIVFTGIPNSNVDYIIQRFKRRIISNGGEFNEDGISIYHRSSGENQKLGACFFSTLRQINPVKLIEELSKKTKLTIFKPSDDNIVGSEYFDEYKRIKDLEYVEIKGDHNFRDGEEREELFKRVRGYLLD